MQKTTIIGLIVGIGGILLGNTLEGGHLNSLVQLAAALIVLGGTFGATLVANRGPEVKKGFQMAVRAFVPEESEREKLIREVVECAKLARKDSILAIEPKLSSLESSFLRDTLRGVVDGIDPNILKEIFQKRIELEEEREVASARIWNDAGGYAPTIGIIGAVLGLIHVMGNLSDTSKLGAGIAVAFVATIYGVGFANLVFLPLGSKLKKIIEEDSVTKEMILDGALGIQSGLSPSIIETKMRSYL